MTEKQIEQLVEELKELELNFIIEDPTLKEINKLFKERFDPSNIVELWFDYGNLSDDGEIVEDHILINDELYKFTLKLDVEWVGDYSVRANVATGFEVTSFSKLS